MKLRTTPFALAILFVLTHQATAQTNWWDASWYYRMPITIQPLQGEPRDATARVKVNFTVALQALNQRAALNPNSLRVVEVNADGRVIDEQVKFQFAPERDFHASKKAQGTLQVLLKDKTELPRLFHLYFDVNAASNAADVQPVRSISSTYRAEEEQQWLVNLSGVETRAALPATRARKVAEGAAVTRPVTGIEPAVPSYLNKPEHQFFAGYCTWYAARKWKEFTGLPVTWHGDGGSWFDHAADEGRPVSDDPRAAVPGAVIVWTRAGRAGHVAFVEEVTEEGIRISEMNAKGLYVVSEAFLPFTNLDKGTKYKFKGYILPE